MSVNVKTDFGAKGDGTTDDTTAIQNAINWLNITGGEVLLPPGTYKITATINMARGVSLLGEGVGGWALTANINATTIQWQGVSGGTMFNFGNRWMGRIENMLLDGNFLADNILPLGAPQSSVFRNLICNATRPGSQGSGITLTTAGQTNPDGSQYPSASQNMFDTVTCINMKHNALVMNGTLSGSTDVGHITENTFLNCNFSNVTATDGSTTVVFGQACDTNQFFGGGITCGPGGTAVQLNYSTVNNAVFGNNFYATAIGTSDGAGVGIDARNNVSHNFFVGCYMVAEGSYLVLNNGGAPGKVKIIGASWGDISTSFRNVTSPAFGVSPWTWTNNTGYAVDFRMWGGNPTALSVTRNGTANGVGGLSSALTNFNLEPGDSITITASAAPTIQIIPH